MSWLSLSCEMSNASPKLYVHINELYIGNKLVPDRRVK
jgi:hypothetical protein